MNTGKGIFFYVKYFRRNKHLLLTKWKLDTLYILNQFGRVLPYIQNALFLSALNQATPFLTALMQNAPFLSALIQLTLCRIALQLESCPTMS